METQFGKHAYIFSMYLQTLDSVNLSRAWPDLKVCAVFRHMKSRGLNHGQDLTMAQSLPLSIDWQWQESVCIVFMTLKITGPSSERAQIKQNIPLPEFSSPVPPERILTGCAQCLSNKVCGL